MNKDKTEQIIEEFDKEFGEFPSLRFEAEGGVVKNVEIAQWKNVKDWWLQKLEEQKQEMVKEVEKLRKELIMTKTMETDISQENLAILKDILKTEVDSWNEALDTVLPIIKK